MTAVIFIGQPRFSSRGPRYDVRLRADGEHVDGDVNGEVIVTGSLVPFFDAARALVARGVTGRLEMWDAERSYPRLAGDIANVARLAIEETETTGPKVRHWRPFAAGTGSAKTADLNSRLSKNRPETKTVAGARRGAVMTLAISAEQPGQDLISHIKRRRSTQVEVEARRSWLHRKRAARKGHDRHDDRHNGQLGDLLAWQSLPSNRRTVRKAEKLRRKPTRAPVSEE